MPARLLKKLPAEALPDNKSCKRSASSSPIESGFRLPCSSNLLGNSTVSSESEPSRGGRSYLSLKSCEAGSRTLRLRRLDLRSRSWRRDEVTVSSESEYDRRSSEPARRCSCGNSTLESRSKRTRLLERAREEATDFGLIRPYFRGLCRRGVGFCSCSGFCFYLCFHRDLATLPHFQAQGNGHHPQKYRWGMARLE